MSAPRVTGFAVYPVTGRDSMELNLSGAHAPSFTLGGRDDAAGMRFLLPDWRFDPKRPALVR